MEEKEDKIINNSEKLINFKPSISLIAHMKITVIIIIDNDNHSGDPFSQ